MIARSESHYSELDRRLRRLRAEVATLALAPPDPPDDLALAAVAQGWADVRRIALRAGPDGAMARALDSAGEALATFVGTPTGREGRQLARRLAQLAAAAERRRRTLSEFTRRLGARIEEAHLPASLAAMLDERLRRAHLVLAWRQLEAAAQALEQPAARAAGPPCASPRGVW